MTVYVHFCMCGVLLKPQEWIFFHFWVYLVVQGLLLALHTRWTSVDVWGSIWDAGGWIGVGYVQSKPMPSVVYLSIPKILHRLAHCLWRPPRPCRLVLWWINSVRNWPWVSFFGFLLSHTWWCLGFPPGSVLRYHPRWGWGNHMGCWR